MKKEVSQPAIIAAVVILVLCVGVFGWLKLRNPAPSVTPTETKAAQQNQMDTMKNAMMKMRQGQPGNR